MTREERARRSCPRRHPLSGRYFDRSNRIRCRFCESEKAIEWHRKGRTTIPRHITRCFPDALDGARLIAATIHGNVQQIKRWLNRKPAEEWEIRQVIAAMELGLIPHPGLPPDEPIPFDPEIDVEPAIIPSMEIKKELKIKLCSKSRGMDLIPLNSPQIINSSSNYVSGNAG